MCSGMSGNEYNIHVPGLWGDHLQDLQRDPEAGMTDKQAHCVPYRDADTLYKNLDV